MATRISAEGKRLLRIVVLKVITELLFIVLPFVIVALVLSYRGSVAHLIYIPEWAIAATVLEGQVLVKFISAFFIIGKDADTVESMSWGGFIFALLLIICFVPTVLTLVFVFLEPEPSYRLAIAQVVTFIIAVLIFFIFAFLLEMAVSAKPVPKTSTPV